MARSCQWPNQPLSSLAESGAMNHTSIPHAPAPIPAPASEPPAADASPPSAPRLKRPPWLIITQIFFALGWLRAVGEKVISVDWWTGETIRLFAAEHAGTTLPWFQPIMDAAVSSAPLTALVVLLVELAVGLGLLANRRLAMALPVAIGLNLAFVAAGAVNPSAFYLVGQGAIALWLVARRPPTPGLSRGLRLATAVAVACAAVSAPAISTLHPALVIDDPAIMFAMFAGLTALACELTHRVVFGRSLP